MSGLALSPAYDLVRRIDLRGDGPEGWFVILRPRVGEPAFLEDLKAEANTWWNREIRVIDASQRSVSELCRHTETHFHFPSGARLSFGITLRKQGSAALPVAYRFCLRLPARSGAECFVFNLNREPHPDPVHEPRFHVHPGFAHFRIPVPALSPLDVLDRIFFVIEPAFSR